MKLFNIFLLLVVVAGSNVQAQDYFIGKSGDTTFCDIIYTTPFKFGYLKSGKVEHVNKKCSFSHRLGLFDSKGNTISGGIF